MFDKEILRKKKEWRQFLKFAKKNPEALLGIADHEIGLGSPREFSPVGNDKSYAKTVMTKAERLPL